MGTEERYAQIETEFLGLKFGCEQFQSYELLQFKIETDQKPSVDIRNLNEMLPSIQRIMMRLQRYDFTLMYKPGKFLIIVHILSRTAEPKNCELLDGSVVAINVNNVIEAIPL